MKRFTKNVLTIGAVAVMTAIILGAFGAHALRDQLTDASLEVFKTGVYYQFMHGFAIIICGILSLQLRDVKLRSTVILYVLGILFFSGSLYLLSTKEVTQIDWAFLGPLTPIGGLLFIAAWVMFIFAIVKK